MMQPIETMALLVFHPTIVFVQQSLNFAENLQLSH